MIKNLMSKFVREKDGGIAEYVIVLGLIALIAIIIGPMLKKMFTDYSDCMDQHAKSALTDVDDTTTESAC